MDILNAWGLEWVHEGDFVDPRRLMPRLEKGEWRLFINQNAEFCIKNITEYAGLVKETIIHLKYTVWVDTSNGRDGSTPEKAIVLYCV